MGFRRMTVSVLVVSFSFAMATRDVAAQAPAHSVTPASLHSAIQASHGEAIGARTYVNSVVAQPEVQKQMKRVGVSSAVLSARFSALSDTEIVQLQRQLMSAQKQNAPAGRMDTTTAYIIGIGLGAVLLLVLLIAAAGSSTPYYYY